MQIDDNKDTSKSDRSDTSYNSSSASVRHTEDEYIQRSRSFTCSEVDYKSVQLKKKARRLTRKVRNARWSKKKVSAITDTSSDKNSEKSNSSHVFKETENVKETIVSEKDNPNPDDDHVNAHGNSVNSNAEMVNLEEETVIPNEQTVNLDEET